MSWAAFDIGYKSPLQFSKEYARKFGMPHKAHAQTLHGQIEVDVCSDLRCDGIKFTNPLKAIFNAAHKNGVKLYI